MKMSSTSKLRVTEVRKSQIRLMASRESPLAAYLYKESVATRESIEYALVAALEQKLQRWLMKMAAVMLLPSAAVAIVLLYIMQNESLLTDIVLFCVFTYIIILCGVLIGGIIANYSVQHRLDGLTRKIAAGDRGRDAIYQTLPELEIVISKTDDTPLAQIVCDDVYRCWSRINGDSAEAQQARTSTEKAIIETINKALSCIENSSSSCESPVSLVESMHVPELVYDLCRISDDFKAKEKPLTTNKERRHLAANSSTPNAVKCTLSAT